jgi:hypothetical protein
MPIKSTPMEQAMSVVEAKGGFFMDLKNNQPAQRAVNANAEAETI